MFVHARRRERPGGSRAGHLTFLIVVFRDYPARIGQVAVEKAVLSTVKIRDHRCEAVLHRGWLFSRPKMKSPSER